jgi:zinc D-Ala-D-Ala carboxypeptidase
VPKARPAASNAAQPADDIPIAQRDRHTPPAANPTAIKSHRKQQLVRVGLIAAVIGLLALGAMFIKNSLSSNGDQASSPAPNNPATINGANSPAADVLLHHFRYEEAPANKLVSINGGFQLRRPAAQKFRAMVAAARAAGVNITTISAFRSVADQKRLFFDVKAERAQVATKRAEVSAPPNYSEHHTGYAVDLGDGNNPAANLNQGFEKTAAFQWLAANAARYSFELSFGQNNTQGVSYEPWHWRYVGDSDSLETFYKAKNSAP